MFIASIEYYNIQFSMEQINTLLNKVFPSKFGLNNPGCEASEFTVLSLLNRLLNDVQFQKAVLGKLTEFTSKTTCYLSGEHLKPKKFASLLPCLKKQIDDGYPENESDNETTESLCHIIDLSVSSRKKAVEIVDIWAFGLEQIDGEFVVNEPGSLYFYPTIIFKSIASKKTIMELGEDGFVAALLVFFRWNLFMEQPKSLSQLVAKQFAEKVNSDGIDAIQNIPQIILNDQNFKLLLNEDIQMALFNEYDNGEGFIERVIDGQTETKTWYSIIDGIRYISTIEYSKNKKYKTFKYDSDLNVIDVKEKDIGDYLSDEESDG